MCCPVVFLLTLGRAHGRARVSSPFFLSSFTLGRHTSVYRKNTVDNFPNRTNGSARSKPRKKPAKPNGPN